MSKKNAGDQPGVLRVALVQTAIGDYRKEFLRAFSTIPGIQLAILTGRVYFEPSVTTRADVLPPVVWLRNYFFLRRQLLWQTGMWRRVMDADVAILEFNPRILSVWCLLAVRRLRRQRSVVWGHAWPRAGRKARSAILRKCMGKLASAVVVYTESQEVELRQYLSGPLIVSAPNALYTAAQIGPAPVVDGNLSFIYVGRLVPSKKPELLLKAFIEATKELPTEVRLVFVGDGPIRETLASQAIHSLPEERVLFCGHINDAATLAALYGQAIASVSPGYVGLAVTQSLSFGIPMLISRSEQHAPEIEAARENFNCVTFASDDIHELARLLVAVWRDRRRWLAAREEIAKDCAARYSVERMVAGMLTAIQV